MHHQILQSKTTVATAMLARNSNFIARLRERTDKVRTPLRAKKKHVSNILPTTTKKSKTRETHLVCRPNCPPSLSILPRASS
jgi:hypothetical protein